MISASIKQDAFGRNRLLPPGVSSWATIFEGEKEIKLSKGTTVFTELSGAHFVYFVVSGMVAVYSCHRNKEILENYYEKGELLHNEALFRLREGNLKAQAITNGTVIKRLSIGVFNNTVQERQHLQADLTDAYMNAMNRTQERLRRMMLLSSEARVVDFLVHYVQLKGRKVGYEWVLQPVFTHQELGLMSGASRQTTTTVLNQLRREGLIHFNRKYLIVRDMEALKKWMG